MAKRIALLLAVEVAVLVIAAILFSWSQMMAYKGSDRLSAACQSYNISNKIMQNETEDVWQKS